ncbi:hypothetical protein AC15_3208 [Escherichia coli 2-156-04_S3_C2]|nr:hypothetical protein AC15_3208 [Escherichia coli 2-156-04_S3_C2]
MRKRLISFGKGKYHKQNICRGGIEVPDSFTLFPILMRNNPNLSH